LPISRVAGIFCLVRQGNVGAFEVSDSEGKDIFPFSKLPPLYLCHDLANLFDLQPFFFLLIFTRFTLVFISMLSDDCQRRHHSPGRGNQSYCY